MRTWTAGVAIAMLLLVSCGSDSEIEAQRNEVDRAIESVVWPAGYNQLTDVTRRDPNLDSLNTQPGTVTFSFEHTGQTLDQIRDDFNESLANAGFLVRSGSCDSDALRVGYFFPDEEVSLAPSLRSEGIEPFVSVQFLWTLPSAESREALAQRAAGELPSCE